MFRYSFALLTACLLTSTCGFQTQEKGLIADSKHRDLILVSVDTLRASRLPFYSALHSEPSLATAGSEDEKFSIAWLASHGVVYDAAFTTAGKTLPSLASFFTGLPPIEHGAISNVTRLQAPTIIQKLHQRGWKAHARVANRALHKFCGLAEGFDSYAVRAKQNEAQLGDDLIIAARTDIEQKNRLLLWAHFMAPHQPYEPLPQYREQLHIPESIQAGNDQLKAAHREPAKHQQLFDAYRDLYDAEIATANQYVQKFLIDLDREYQQSGRGTLLENAVVVFFSDHGEELADRNGYFLHAKSLYSSVVRVPLIILDENSSLSGHNEQLIDISKTLEHVLYATDQSSTTVVSAWHNDFFAIRNKRFTLVHNPSSNPQGPFEPPEDVPYLYPDVALYDRLNDPFELLDVASEYPDVVSALGAELFDWYAEKAAIDSEIFSGLDEHTLSELGYSENPVDPQNSNSRGPWSPQMYNNER